MMHESVVEGAGTGQRSGVKLTQMQHTENLCQLVLPPNKELSTIHCGDNIKINNVYLLNSLNDPVKECTLIPYPRHILLDKFIQNRHSP